MFLLEGNQEDANVWEPEAIYPPNCLLEVHNIQMVMTSPTKIYLIGGSIECSEDLAAGKYKPNETIVGLEHQCTINSNGSYNHTWHRHSVNGVKIKQPGLLLRPVVGVVTIGASKDQCIVLYGGYDQHIFLSGPLADLEGLSPRAVLSLPCLTFTRVTGVVKNGWYSGGIGKLNFDNSKLILFGGSTGATNVPNHHVSVVDLANLSGANRADSLFALQEADNYKHRNTSNKKPRATVSHARSQNKVHQLLTSQQLHKMGKSMLVLFISHPDTLVSAIYLKNMHLQVLSIQTAYPVPGQPTSINLTKEQFMHFITEQNDLRCSLTNQLYPLVSQLVDQALAAVGDDDEHYLEWHGQWSPPDHAAEMKQYEQKKKQAAAEFQLLQNAIHLQEKADQETIKIVLFEMINTAVATKEAEEQHHQHAMTERNNNRPFCFHFHKNNIADSFVVKEYGAEPKVGANMHDIMHRENDFWNAAIREYDTFLCLACGDKVGGPIKIAYCKSCEHFELRYPHPNGLFDSELTAGRRMYCTTCLPLAGCRKRKRRGDSSQEMWKLGVKNVVVNDPILK
tara:strand:+ start:2681 stop:4378 length:1698 start_codon:yes stop_codon:yes gene_type:complete